MITPLTVLIFFICTGNCFSSINFDFNNIPVRTSSFDNIPDSGNFRPSPYFDSSIALTIPLNSKPLPFFMKEFPVQPSSFVRFTFTFDSFPAETGRTDTNHPSGEIEIFRLITDDRKETPLVRTLLRLSLVRNGDWWRLIPAINKLDEQNSFFTKLRGWDIGIATPYCIEYGFLLSPDSFINTLTLRLNGATEERITLPPRTSRLNQHLVCLGGYQLNSVFRGTLYFDNLAFAEDRIGHPPRKPAMVSVSGLCRVLPLSLFLVSPAFSSWLTPASHGATRWQIRGGKASWDLPLYDSGPDTTNRNSIPLLLTLLPSQKYEWRLRHIDASGNQSDWSDPASLPDLPDTTLPAQVAHVKSAGFFSVSTGKSVAKIIPGEWYDFSAVLDREARFPQAAYAIFWFNDSSLTTGTPKNRGGFFDPAANYIVNVAFDTQIFEKGDSGSYRTTQLIGRQGRYIDASGNRFTIDPENGSFRCRLRLLPQARPGLWSIRGFVRNTKEEASPLFYDTFRVVSTPLASSRGARNPFWPGFFMAVGLAIGISLFVRYRIRKTRSDAPVYSSREQEILKLFDGYVETHLHEEMDADVLAKQTGISYFRLYKIVSAAKNKSIKAYILGRKIERARELFQTTDKTVAEVAAATGFNDPFHFSKLFKKYTGKSPSELKGRQ